MNTIRSNISLCQLGLKHLLSIRSKKKCTNRFEQIPWYEDIFLLAVVCVSHKRTGLQQQAQTHAQI